MAQCQQMYAQCLSCDECRVLVATSQAHATCHALATCHVQGAYSHHLARPRHTHKQPRNRDGQSETQNKHVNSTLILLACQGQAMEAFERRSLAFCKECHLQSTQLSKKKRRWRKAPQSNPSSLNSYDNSYNHTNKNKEIVQQSTGTWANALAHAAHMHVALTHPWPRGGGKDYVWKDSMCVHQVWCVTTTL